MLGVVLLLLAFAGVHAGNTTCKTTSLDWYTQSVGETPCRTYERLRQNCNAQYQVGNFGPNPPGDSCNDQLSACCCNSVAFSLSMLCQNCQYGVGGNDNGYDGSAGTYQFYLGGCGVGVNQSLPNATQAAVCNQDIKIPNYLYQLFWNTGAWYYTYTKQTAQLQIQSGQNGTRCTPPKSTGVTPSGPAPTSTAPNSDPGSEDSSGPNIGAIVGGVVGGVGLILIAALVFWFSRRRRSREIVDLTEEQEGDMSFEPYIDGPATTQLASSNALVPPTPYTASSDTGSSAFLGGQALPNRPGKIGMLASGPTNRDESGPSTLAPYSSDRHEDSAELTDAVGLGRSPSGRLPPTYQER